ncbi:hypothetical protein CPLU01_03838 [Colletotrichum plurivorum]|uniref:Uncharacterized protein n=1 Tax=Colletotrichum plurivorum TaxID=2175906 RepID=A0A8H6KR23_9PEZI|nr:hypothetical protein CPLU01_03838 [Colletotrichum plurivorum]
MVSAVPGSVKTKAPLIASRLKSIPRHYRRISPLSSPMHHETISRYLGARLNGVACPKKQLQGPARTGRAELAPYSLRDGSHADGCNWEHSSCPPGTPCPWLAPVFCC